MQTNLDHDHGDEKILEQAATWPLVFEGICEDCDCHFHSECLESRTLPATVYLSRKERGQ